MAHVWYLSSSKSSYQSEARWTGFQTKNCTDPKLLYENIVAKSMDFIGYVTYSYFNKDKSDKIRPKDENANEIFKPIDLKSYGRCYTG